jgi:hypothetical protein
MSMHYLLVSVCEISGLSEHKLGLTCVEFFFMFTLTLADDLCCFWFMHSTLCPKFNVALHASHVALPMVTQKCCLNVPILMLD